MSKKNIFDNNNGATQPAAPSQDATVPSNQGDHPESSIKDPASSPTTPPAAQEPATPPEETTPTSDQPESSIKDQASVPVPTHTKKILNPQRVIDANLVNAVKLFVSTDESRYVLGGICFTTNEEGKPIAVATTGKALAVAEMLVVDADEYPVFPNGGYGQDTKDEIIVPVKPLLDALRKIPKKTTLPILMTPPIISLKNDKGETTTVCIPVTDLDSHTLETTRVIDGRFPNYRQVVPSENSTAIEIELDANIMLDIAQAAIAFTKNGSAHLVPVKVCVPFDSHSPVRCEVKDKPGRRLTMVVMPLRDNGELVNRIEHRGLVAVAERLEAAATVLEAIGQKKARRPAETMKQAA